MSKGDDRRREEAERVRDHLRSARPNEEPPRYSPDPLSWASMCMGWREQVHEPAPHNRRKCRWCWREFPTER